MGLARYLFNDFFTAAELDAMDEKLAKLGQLSGDARAESRSTNARIDALQADLERVAMLARALADLCLTRNLATRDELARLLLDADIADGKSDQRLQAKVVMPGESKAADPEPSHDPASLRAKTKRNRPYP